MDSVEPRFDFNNAHGRWLRGLALQHENRLEEAKAECLRAVECARLQGKHQEALQWEQDSRLRGDARFYTSLESLYINSIRLWLLFV